MSLSLPLGRRLHPHLRSHMLRLAGRRRGRGRARRLARRKRAGGRWKDLPAPVHPRFCRSRRWRRGTAGRGSGGVLEVVERTGGEIGGSGPPGAAEIGDVSP